MPSNFPDNPVNGQVVEVNKNIYRFMSVRFNLSNIPGFLSCVKNNIVENEFKENYELNEYTNNGETYSIVTYNKHNLTDDNIDTYGLLRSVVIRNSKVVSFSPPKSYKSFDSYLKRNALD